MLLHRILVEMLVVNLQLEELALTGVMNLPTLWAVYLKNNKIG
jgi:hypothetical protein